MTLYDKDNILGGFGDEIERLRNPQSNKQHARVLQDILDNLEEIDFRARAGLKEDERVTQKIQVVVAVEVAIRYAAGGF